MNNLSTYTLNLVSYLQIFNLFFDVVCRFQKRSLDFIRQHPLKSYTLGFYRLFLLNDSLRGYFKDLLQATVASVLVLLNVDKAQIQQRAGGRGVGQPGQ